MKITKIALTLFTFGGYSLAHQGCNVDAAFDTLLGEATIQHVSESVLQGLQRNIKTVLHDIEATTPQQVADDIVDRYRVLQGLLAYAGIHLPLI
ncbi:hypothetical protein GGI07_004957 [Coemansia sp. Benny D115]|nr:hypothetical protein GGI07_004957 [Coemansia sp. Benny D115]